MTLAAVAKDLRFYKWPNINYIGIYETPIDGTSIKNISWSCDGRKVVAVKTKGCPVIIEVPDKKEQMVFSECSYINHVSVGVFSNNIPDLVAYGTDEGYVLIYNIRHTRRPQECLRLSTPIQNLDFSSDDNFIAVGSASGPVVLFNSNYKPCASFSIPNNAPLSILTFSKYTSNLLAAADKNSVVSLWNTETSDILFTSKQHSARITDVAFFENGLSSVGMDSKFVSYDLRSYKANCCILDCPLSSLAYLNRTYDLAVSTVSGQIRNYDSRNLKSPLKTLVAIANSGVKKIAFPFHPHLYYQDNRKKYEDDFSASGDFSIASGSSPRRSQVGSKNTKTSIEGVVENDSSELVESVTNHSHENFEEINKIIEDKLNAATKEFEEKLIQTFYRLRIVTSKQFISLEERIAQNWNSFVDYLKLSGQGIVPSTSALGVHKSDDNMSHTDDSTETIDNDENQLF